MPVLADLLDALRTGRVEVVDLTAPLHPATPVLQLPPPFANASPFALTEISRFDDRGPAWTDAGAAHSFDPAFPCHSYLLGAGKYGLTQLQNLARLPATGAVVVAGPLPIVSGSGSPARVLALVER